MTDVVSFNGFAAPVATRLDERHAAGGELWVEAEMALGRPAAIETLDTLVARYPLREHLAALRMLALYRCRTTGGRARLIPPPTSHPDDELGIRPSAKVEALHQQVPQAGPCLDPAAEKPTVPAEEPENAEAAPPRPRRPPRFRPRLDAASSAA